MSKLEKTIVVIGHGMVGHRFCERMVQFDESKTYRIVTFCEEPRAAYDRVGLTSFFAHRDAEQLMLARLEWYQQQGIELHIGDRANAIDRERKVVTSDKGLEIEYDIVVMATGSYPFVPPIPGVEKSGVFVYRTIEDLEKIIEYGGKVKQAAVIGGGLLGLEAAKAAFDLGLETHVIEFASRLMPRQVDEAGSRILKDKMEELGVKVHLDTATDEILGNGSVAGMKFKDGRELDVGMIIVSAGIRPRDELAEESGIELGPRGGVLIDDELRTSDPSIFAIGEVALHQNMIYGLVAPGYEMAEKLAANLCGDTQTFNGADLSTKLKLMGVDVASFGDYEAGPDAATSLVAEDPFSGKYKRLFFTKDGKKLVGGILVGDASEYGTLSAFAKAGEDLPAAPTDIMGLNGGGGAALGGVEAMPDSAQICSCNNVSKAQICTAIEEQECDSPLAVKACTTAGSGCGGCMPLVTDLFNAEMKRLGRTVNKDLCEHFAYTRQELFDICRVKKINNFADLLKEAGKGTGCEVCKPTAASIFASLFNDVIVDPKHATLQDTNDRFLANMQRGGLYSVVPRVPGGEILPDQLIVLGQVAKKYGLYSKITGGQRVDLFGAKMQDLPNIWEELIAAGFESGHAYGKALRTVKSCVGSSWCRYGVQDSVKFAIQVEERYRGIRAPHKMKMAVSGCTRECAEAQSKDFGLIATETGYNLYVCGNGGQKPRHADLIATDLSEEDAIKLMDRVMMFYIQTADRLTRTSVWLEKMDGGLDYLKSVVVDDKLGICDELERQMQFLVDTYQCEWKAVVDDPAKRKFFQQFVNTGESEPIIEMVDERGQQRPEYWSKVGGDVLDLKVGEVDFAEARRSANTRLVPVGKVWDFPQNGGAAVKVGKSQIAVFHFASRGEWYATQNMCPHKKAFVLSRGIIGDKENTPKVSCPLHKKNFSLETGECISGEDYSIATFPVRIKGDDVILELPPEDILDAALSTQNFCKTGCSSSCATA
ncbi:nitrite reductase large subunit NirB [Cerasicoccus frondis]|uniref:nitrite reductase large subunit NirB n=1 Tax=Cerasicoccus frondis TaxID=490090 RepID=UPI00285262E6|nr:nitrite reductase large subunit NirB [Cerasicoccus frondis]